jgi:hypothetical protein
MTAPNSVSSARAAMEVARHLIASRLPRLSALGHPPIGHTDPRDRRT